MTGGVSPRVTRAGWTATGSRPPTTCSSTPITGGGSPGWYVVHLFPEVRAGVPVSVHDVFHGWRAKPFSEGSVVLRWLDERGIPFFTTARRKAPDVQQRPIALKDELGLGEPVRVSSTNPMIFFRMGS